MTGDDKRAVFAATLGWTMDAFDYFRARVTESEVWVETPRSTG